MNILLITGFRVGKEWWRMNLFKYLCANGHELYRLDEPSHWLKRPSGSNSRVVVPTLFWPSRFASSMHVRRAQETALRRVSSEIDVVWITHPDFHWAWRLFPHATKLYDAFDYFPDLDPSRYDEVLENERIATQTADLVLCASKANYDRLRANTENCMYLPNAVDPPTLFMPADRPRSRTLGVVSYSESRIDWELLSYISDGVESLTIEVITNAERRTVTDRISILGPVAPGKLRDVMCQWSVGLIAYPDTEFNAYAAPLKIFEYVAAGCNVVGISNAELLEYSLRYPFIRHVKTKADLREAVRESLTEQISVAEQSAFLARENWERRAYAAAKAIESVKKTVLSG